MIQDPRSKNPTRTSSLPHLTTPLQLPNHAFVAREQKDSLPLPRQQIRALSLAVLRHAASLAPQDIHDPAAPVAARIVRRRPVQAPQRGVQVLGPREEEAHVRAARVHFVAEARGREQDVVEGLDEVGRLGAAAPAAAAVWGGDGGDGHEELEDRGVPVEGPVRGRGDVGGPGHWRLEGDLAAGVVRDLDCADVVVGFLRLGGVVLLRELAGDVAVSDHRCGPGDEEVVLVHVAPGETELALGVALAVFVDHAAELRGKGEEAWSLVVVGLGLRGRRRWWSYGNHDRS